MLRISKSYTFSDFIQTTYKLVEDDFIYQGPSTLHYYPCHRINYFDNTSSGNIIFTENSD